MVVTWVEGLGFRGLKVQRRGLRFGILSGSWVYGLEGPRTLNPKYGKGFCVGPIWEGDEDGRLKEYLSGSFFLETTVSSLWIDMWCLGPIS